VRAFSVYRTILEDLEGQYVLGYVSDNTAQDGKYRRIRIQVDRKRLNVRHREGCCAPSASRLSARVVGSDLTALAAGPGICPVPRSVQFLYHARDAGALRPGA
jgi:hypothetical protein